MAVKIREGISREQLYEVVDFEAMDREFLAEQERLNGAYFALSAHLDRLDKLDRKQRWKAMRAELVQVARRYGLSEPESQGLWAELRTERKLRPPSGAPKATPFPDVRARRGNMSKKRFAQKCDISVATLERVEATGKASKRTRDKIENSTRKNLQ